MKHIALKTFAAALLAGTAVAGMGTSASAADLPSAKMAPVAPVEVWNPWMFRARALFVMPQERSTLYALPGGAQIPGAHVAISNSVVPEVDFTYFFTRNIAVEVIAGVTPHSVKGSGVINGIPIGSAWLLPPTVTLQYHFTGLGAFKPYVGAGVNYTIFFNEKAKTAWGWSKFDLKDNFGLALQAGVDIMLNKNWGINLDVKKIFLQTDAKVYVGGLPAVKAKVNIDPWIIGAGITYKW